MPTLLRIDSSVRGSESNSSRLADYFCELWKETYGSGDIISRHVGIEPPSHPTHEYTIANYVPPNERTAEMKAALAESDNLIDELLSADELLFAVPMYNFSVPSTLKAYIDNIVRIGRTFEITADGQLAGLMSGKKLTIVSTRGASYTPPSPIESFDCLTPYIKVVMGFMGVTNIEFITADDLDFSGPVVRKSQMNKALDAIKSRFL